MQESFKFKVPHVGGSGGSEFDDVKSSGGAIAGIQSITIRHGDVIDSIQVTYHLNDGGIYVGEKHGGDGGKAAIIPFAAGETIYQITGKGGDLLDGISLISTVLPNGKTRTHGPFGGNGGSAFILTGAVAGFYGRSGSRVDQLGFYQNVYPIKIAQTVLSK